jgi:hypothetical protein
LLGIVDARLGDCARAVIELDTFLSRVPVDDPRAIEAITVRDRCKEELTAKIGTLSVESSPSGAEVRLDVQDKAPDGVTPWRNDQISVGNHVVFLRKPGYLQGLSAVQISRGGLTNVQIALQPEPVAAPPPVVNARPAPAPQVIVAQSPPPPPKKSKAWIAAVVVPLGVVVIAGAIGLGFYEADKQVYKLPPVGGM